MSLSQARLNTHLCFARSDGPQCAAADHDATACKGPATARDSIGSGKHHVVRRSMPSYVVPAPRWSTVPHAIPPLLRKPPSLQHWRALQIAGPMTFEVAQFDRGLESTQNRRAGRKEAPIRRRHCDLRPGPPRHARSALGALRFRAKQSARRMPHRNWTTTGRDQK